MIIFLTKTVITPVSAVVHYYSLTLINLTAVQVGLHSPNPLTAHASAKVLTTVGFRLVPRFIAKAVQHI